MELEIEIKVKDKKKSKNKVNNKNTIQNENNYKVTFGNLIKVEIALVQGKKLLIFL